MNATTKSTTTVRPSMCWPIVNSTPPDCHHVHVRTTGDTNCSSDAELTRWIHCHAAPLASTRLPRSESTPISLPFFGNFLPNKMISTKPMVGTTGASHALSRNQPPDSGESVSEAANMLSLASR